MRFTDIIHLHTATHPSNNRCTVMLLDSLCLSRMSDEHKFPVSQNSLINWKWFNDFFSPFIMFGIFFASPAHFPSTIYNLPSIHCWIQCTTKTFFVELNAFGEYTSVHVNLSSSSRCFCWCIELWLGLSCLVLSCLEAVSFDSAVVLLSFLICCASDRNWCILNGIALFRCERR